MRPGGDYHKPGERRAVVHGNRDRDARVGWYGTNNKWQHPSNFGTAKLVTEGTVALRPMGIRPDANLRTVREGVRAIPT